LSPSPSPPPFCGIPFELDPLLEPDPPAEPEPLPDPEPPDADPLPELAGGVWCS
jgi:hypothetical protein